MIKALEILEKLAIKKTGYASQKEKDQARAFYREAIVELEALIEKDKSKKCEECYKKTNRVLALVEQRESDAKHTVIKLIRELEALENRSCENCKQWVGNAPFKGFCNVTGSSCCLGGCNDYFEPKG